MSLFLHLFFFYTIDTYIIYSKTFAKLRHISISSQLSAQRAEPPWGAEPRFELGPALQQANALPTEPRCTELIELLDSNLYDLKKVQKKQLTLYKYFIMIFYRVPLSDKIFLSMARKMCR
jgi:hypothetical protein